MASVPALSPLANQINASRWLEIMLDSGTVIQIKAVRLYDEFALGEINSKRATALKKLGGVSLGMGAIGSLNWVLASSAAIGAVEGILSSVSASAGMDLIQEVVKMEKALRTQGKSVPVEKIENIETPNPGLWRAPCFRQTQVEVGAKFFSGEKIYETRDVPSGLIHSGAEFVEVLSQDGAEFSIRWSAVVRYACKQS